MGDLEKALPGDIANAAARYGNELVLSLSCAKTAVRVAGENSIAVLGVEVFEILNDGLAVDGYSVYEFFRLGDWKDFVTLNNAAALRFIEENDRGERFGYVLTSTSEREFDQLG
jgi:hypothetical protein